MAAPSHLKESTSDQIPYKYKKEINKDTKMAVTAWGDSSSYSEGDQGVKNISMDVNREEEFGFVDETDDEDDKEVTFLDIKKNLKNYSLKI